MISSSRCILNSALRSTPAGSRGWRALQAPPPIGLAPCVQPRFSNNRRWKSGTSPTGDPHSGHIVLKPNESILFLDNIFPRTLRIIFWRRWYSEKDVAELLKKFENSTLGITDPISMVKRAIPSSLPIKVTEITPMLKDGGAFVKFSPVAEGTSATDIERTLARLLQEKPIKPWFNPFASVNVRLVKGNPWLEDLYRFPKSRLKVEFCAPNPDVSSGAGGVELSQESLFSLFRKYGKIAEITAQPSDSKTMPRFAYVDFVWVRDAIMARNCMHGLVVGEEFGGGRSGTRLRLSYEQRVKPHHIWSWLTSHPRIVIPVVAALLAAITVVIFDPIREFFIRVHIQKSFRLSNSRLYRWFKSQTDDIFASRKRKGEQAGLQALWSQRRDIIEKVQTWLMETADTFIVVQGPRGSGTKELIIDQALKGRKNVLVIDCKPVVEARGESAIIRKLAFAVGYRPVFSWANSLSSLVDLAVQSTTGVKSGFSETLESQIVKILQSTASALKDVSLSERRKEDKKTTGSLAFGGGDKDGGSKEDCDDGRDASLSDDAYLEAHPERRAVVVIDNFLHGRDDDCGRLVYDKIAEWAAALVQSNIAHVVFLTNDSSYSKSLSKSLPDRVFRQVALGDLESDVAKNYVLSHLEGLDCGALAADTKSELEEEGKREIEAEKKGDEQEKQTRWWPHHHQHKQSGYQESSSIEPWSDADAGRRKELAELDTCINTLGGRLTDLEFLARRLKSGQSPTQAVAEIVEQSSSEIIKIFLLGKGGKGRGGGNVAAAGDDDNKSGGGKKWSPEQAWYLIKEIAAKKHLRYHEVLLAGTFSSSMSPSASDGEAAIEALAAAELVTVTWHRGRPQTIKAGKPVYEAAFGRLAADMVLRARMDMAVLKELAAIETKGIEKVEAELALLGGLPRQPRETGDRVNYLLAKLQASQGKIVALEREMGVLKKVLVHEA